jgi:hypothetical protein
MADGHATIISVASIQRIPPSNLGTLTAGNAAYPEADLGIFVPFSVPNDVTCRRMFWRNGAVADATIDVGIYGSDGTRLTSSGPTGNTGTNAWQAVDVTDQALSANTLYYMAITNSVAGAGDTLYRYTTGLTGGGGYWGMYGVLKQASLASSTLPATATMEAWANEADYMPMFGLTTSTTQPTFT